MGRGWVMDTAVCCTWIRVRNRCRSLRTPGNILVVNLAVSDCLLVGETSMLIYNSLHRGPALGDVGCQVYGFVGGLAGTVSICSLTFIALDRYHVIVYPLDARRRTGHTQALLCVSLAWLYGALFAGLPLTGLGVGRYVPEGFLTSCSFDYLSQDAMNRNFILAFCVAAWVLPFCIISYCYARICVAVLKARHSGQGWLDDSSKHCKDQEKHRLELRLATVVLAVVGLWFVSWTPYAVVALMGVLGLHAHITPLSSMLPAAFCKTASCVDPFVYAVTHPRFRQELLAMTGLGCEVRAGRRRAKKKKKLRAVTAAESRDPHRESDVEEIIMVGVLGCTVRSTHTSRAYASSSSSSSSSSSKLSLHEGGETSAPQDVAEAGRAERRNSRKRPYLTRGNPSLSFEDTTAGFALPSWFVSPKPRKNRSTSLRHKDRESEDC
ncbi:opsin, ultraviolet-sensitive-like isoform X2 [Bacillus rossius redtenbacheri]|uniref:opsin, ultraviolet-sensitive-like isoform X2 n=1 Tax=Bacillus rossius redtenbacheri TaxID=93214 RepID=UPI002FDEC41C